MKRILSFLGNRFSDGRDRETADDADADDLSKVTQIGIPIPKDKTALTLHSPSTVTLPAQTVPTSELFKVNKPPRKPYLYVATGRLVPTATARHYVRIRPYYGHADPIQSLLPAGRTFIQTVIRGERRPENQELWSILCLRNTPTHVIHMGYVNESRTRNWDLLYLAVHLHGHPLHYASSIAIELGEFLTHFLTVQAEDADRRKMTVVKPGSSAAQVFWVALMFVKYRALMLGEASIGRDDQHQ